MSSFKEGKMVVTSFITKKKWYFFIYLVWDTNRTIIKARGALFGIGYFSLVWDTDQTIFFFFFNKKQTHIQTMEKE